MKFRPVHFLLGLGLLTSIACLGGTDSSEFQVSPRVRLAFLGSLTGAAALYRVDGTTEIELVSITDSSTPSDFVSVGEIQNYAEAVSLRVKSNNQVLETRSFTLTAGSKNTVAVASQGQTAPRIQNFPINQIAVPAGQWNFAFGHMAVGYTGAVDVYVIRGTETIQTAGRAFASVGQYAGTTYRLGDTPGNSIAICPAGTRQPLVTIPYPTSTAIPGRRFTVFLRGTGQGQGSLSTFITAD